MEQKFTHTVALIDAPVNDESALFTNDGRVFIDLGRALDDLSVMLEAKAADVEALAAEQGEDSPEVQSSATYLLGAADVLNALATLTEHMAQHGEHALFSA